MRLKPCVAGLVVSELADHDAVDRRPSLTDSLDLVARQFPNPQHPRTLQTGVREITRFALTRVSNASPNSRLSQRSIANLQSGRNTGLVRLPIKSCFKETGNAPITALLAPAGCVCAEATTGIRW